MEKKDGELRQLRMEHHVMNLLESFQAIHSTLELEEVLKKIIHFALNIADTAGAGYIQLYDETSNKLVVKTSVGFKEHIQQFRVNMGESITGKVFRDGNGKLLTTRSEIYNQMGDLNRKNFDLIDGAHDNNRNIKSMLSVPVSLGKERIGVMTIHCFEIEDGLNETDLLLLKSFAFQAATAIHNARLHTEVQQSLMELKETNVLLEKQTEIHNRLTRLSVLNKGLTTLMTEMNKMMDRNNFYIDYLEGNHFPQYNKHFNGRPDDLFLLFAHKTNPAYASIQDAESTLDCYVYPIRSGSIFLGCLIVEGDSPLSQLDRLIVEQGAPILSLEIMKSRSQTEMMYKKTYEAYQQFLKMKNSRQAESAAKRLGIHHHSFLLTAIIELDGNEDFLSLENNALIFLTSLKKKMAMKNGILFSYNNKIIFFCSSQDAALEARMTRNIESSLTWWNERFSVTARAGISTGHYYPGQAEENHSKAEKALLHLKTQNKEGMLHYRDIGISRLFLHHSQEEIHSFLRETLSSLWEDESQELLYTLLVYIQNNRAMTVTARELHIHTNTLYNRLRKIEKVLDLDFNCYEDYLRMQLAVYLYKNFVESS